ncbi:hypothetical protein JQN58_05270 [Aneurinibacillus sp. BA2021]|nr:hypothetical protein [Aneurinibacillus sp. BA2021]
MFFNVPIINGVLDIDYEDLLGAFVISDSMALVRLKEYATKRDSWVEITKEEFERHLPKPNDPIAQILSDQNAVMFGLMDVYSKQQQTETNRVQDADAVMMGMMDLYTQNAELKAELAAIKAKLEGGA